MYKTNVTLVKICNKLKNSTSCNGYRKLCLVQYVLVDYGCMTKNINRFVFQNLYGLCVDILLTLSKPDRGYSPNTRAY